MVEAALDAGASRLEIMRMIIIPLSKSGIALGSVFVVSMVMGDFFVIKVMSGGGVCLGGRRDATRTSACLQYPRAAASAVVLTSSCYAGRHLILRTSTSRKEIAR